METRVNRFWDVDNVERRRRDNHPRNTPGPGTEPFTHRARSSPNGLVTTEVTLTLNDDARNNVLQQLRTDQDNNGVSNM